MADARISRIAFVMVAQAFQRMAQIDRMMMAVLRLELCNPVAAFGHLVGMPGFGAAVMRVDFCA